MTKIFLPLTIALVAGSGLVSCKCSQEQTDVASDNFKDCMDEKKAALLQIDTGVGDKKQHICDSLGDLATVCGSAVDSLAGCKGREYVDNLVAIHINSMSEILSSFHPDVSLADCPVLATKPPTIVGSGDRDGANPAYVTSDNAAPASLYPHIMATLLLAAKILHQLL